MAGSARSGKPFLTAPCKGCYTDRSAGKILFRQRTAELTRRTLVFRTGKRLLQSGHGAAAVAVGALLIGGAALAGASHGAVSVSAQAPSATATAGAGAPPPPPPPPPPGGGARTATPSAPPPPPPPPSTATRAPTVAPTARPPIASPTAQAPAQKPAPAQQKPAAVQLPNTGAGGVADTDTSPLLPATAGLGAVVMIAGGVFALRSRKHED